MTATTAPAAVFLSYASQDGEAARRLAEALRAAGVEVWFDQNELVGGDAWDAKIRGQIGACALFVPLISAATQARREGYFRLEWKLAAQRTHAMADGTPFLLPVVLDETRDADALVPAEFKAVQWTRLPDATEAEKFCARVRRLLYPVAPPAPNSAPGSPMSAGHTPRPSTSLKILAITSAGLLLLGLALWFVRPPHPPSPPQAGDKKPENDALNRVAALIDFNAVNTAASDFALGEQLLDRELAREPFDPRANILAAWLHNTVLMRGFDLSEERAAKARRFSEQAFQLAPNDPEALGALGFYLWGSGADFQRAETLLRQAVKLAPREPKLVRILGWTIHTPERAAEKLEFFRQAVADFPRDALVRYDYAINLTYVDMDRGAREIEAAIAIEPISTAIRDRAWIALCWEGDISSMSAWLDRIPDRFRSTEMAAFARYGEAMLTGRTADALRLIGSLPDSWLRQNGEVPKALLVGELMLRDGKSELARAQFEAALTHITAARRRAPDDITLRIFELITLLHLGRPSEAREHLAIIMQAAPRQTWAQGPLFWFGPLQCALLLENKGAAIAYLRASATDAIERRILKNLLRLDPRLARWRDDPDLAAALAEPAPSPESVSSAAPAPTPAPDASVSVLAFANLSSDPENEYFSDGVSEELLNVLAKIPGLKVSARTSAFHFKGKDTPIPEIARQLGVAHVVEGSVRKSGTKVRITAQLIRAADGFHVWSETYDRDLRDIFAVQDEIAALIVRELRSRLASAPAAAPGAPGIAGEIRAASRDRTANLAAYEAFLEAKHQLNRKTPESVMAAIPLFERATTLDPDYALAWANLAFAYNWAVSFEKIPAAEAVNASRAAAAHAIALAPDLPEAHAAAGDSDLVAWRWVPARRSSERALALAPGHPEVLQAASWCALVLGDQALSERLARRALEVDPFNLGAYTTLGMAIQFAGRFAESAATSQRLTELAPDSSLPRILGWHAMIFQSRWEEALALAPPPPHDLWAECFVRHGQGRHEESDALLARILARPKDFSAFDLARLHAFRGEADLAFARLDQAREAHANGLLVVKTDPLLAPLHADPRWPEFLRTMGLADDQLAP